MEEYAAWLDYCASCIGAKCVGVEYHQTRPSEAAVYPETREEGGVY